MHARTAPWKRRGGAYFPSRTRSPHTYLGLGLARGWHITHEVFSPLSQTTRQPFTGSMHLAAAVFAVGTRTCLVCFPRREGGHTRLALREGVLGSPTGARRACATARAARVAGKPRLPFWRQKQRPSHRQAWPARSSPRPAAWTAVNPAAGVPARLSGSGRNPGRSAGPSSVPTAHGRLNETRELESAYSSFWARSVFVPPQTMAVPPPRGAWQPAQSGHVALRSQFPTAPRAPAQKAIHNAPGLWGGSHPQLRRVAPWPWVWELSRTPWTAGGPASAPIPPHAAHVPGQHSCGRAVGGLLLHVNRTA